MPASKRFRKVRPVYSWRSRGFLRGAQALRHSTDVHRGFQQKWAILARLFIRAYQRRRNKRCGLAGPAPGPSGSGVKAAGGGMKWGEGGMICHVGERAGKTSDHPCPRSSRRQLTGTGPGGITGYHLLSIQSTRQRRLSKCQCVPSGSIQSPVAGSRFQPPGGGPGRPGRARGAGAVSGWAGWVGVGSWTAAVVDQDSSRAGANKRSHMAIPGWAGPWRKEAVATLPCFGKMVQDGNCGGH
jgi:hypothetical protein